MNVIVAITGASGAIYARQTLELLLRSDEVADIALVMSDHARDVVEAEGVVLPEADTLHHFSNHDMWSSLASGSARWDAMIVVPCSMGTVARVASGVSRTLIERAADVMLKERRALVMVVREAPYSLIHLRNMTTLTEAGAIVVPASPSFYFQPLTIDELAMTISSRAVEMLGVSVAHRSWGESR
ncbi:MAG: UbiX family flavin prenyltransferase [Alistipes sp.]|nr:UbiX family flavin prenyltransferase [Alistipes sp.]